MRDYCYSFGLFLAVLPTTSIDLFFPDHRILFPLPFSACAYYNHAAFFPQSKEAKKSVDTSLVAQDAMVATLIAKIREVLACTAR